MPPKTTTIEPNERNFAHHISAKPLFTERLRSSPTTLMPPPGPTTWMPDPELIWTQEKVSELAANARNAFNAIGHVHTLERCLEVQRKSADCQRDQAQEKLDEATLLTKRNEAKAFLAEWGLQWDTVANMPCERQPAHPKLGTVEDLIRMMEKENKATCDIMRKYEEAHAALTTELTSTRTEHAKTMVERNQLQELANARDRKLMKQTTIVAKWKCAEIHIQQLESTLKVWKLAYDTLEKTSIFEYEKLEKTSQLAYEKLETEHDTTKKELITLQESVMTNAERVEGVDTSFQHMRTLLACKLGEAKTMTAALHQAIEDMDMAGDGTDGDEMTGVQEESSSVDGPANGQTDDTI